MKLTIKSGESVDHAIQYLTDFLNAKKEEYPLLKGNMNIYITLEGYGHKDCPENQGEYVLTGESVEDVEHRRYDEARKLLKQAWERLLRSEASKFNHAVNEISKAESSLKSAEERNLVPRTIELRKKAVEKAKENLPPAEARYDLILKLKDIVDNNKVTLYFEKVVDGKMTYSYKITPYYIFENVDGFTGNFRGVQGKDGGFYGYLQEGLPYNYKKAKGA